MYLQTVLGAKKDRAQTLSLQFVQSLNACRTYFLSWWSYVDDSAGDNADEGMNLGDEKRAPVGKEWGPNRHGHWYDFLFSFSSWHSWPCYRIHTLCCSGSVGSLYFGIPKALFFLRKKCVSDYSLAQTVSAQRLRAISATRVSARWEHDAKTLFVIWLFKIARTSKKSNLITFCSSSQEWWIPQVSLISVLVGRLHSFQNSHLSQYVLISGLFFTFFEKKLKDFSG